MVAQALCKDYHQLRGPARCTLKVDIHKTFDTVNWNFIHQVLIRMRFPEVFINWVMTCISTGTYPVKINGPLEGFSRATSDIRQGDALSPCLFVLAPMEVLTVCIKKFTTAEGYKQNWRNLTHITFADDVLLCCKGEVDSVTLLMKGLALFSSISGLKPNLQKSNCFFGNVRLEVVQNILAITGFNRGEFLSVIWDFP